MLAALLFLPSLSSAGPGRAQEAAPAAGRTEEASESELAFFEKEVRPLLAEHCYECHSAAKARPKGGLRLDTRAGWVKGGDSGPALVPGDTEASRLVRAVRYTDDELEMPPDGKLSASAIAVLEEWVRRGAPDPRMEPDPRTETELPGGTSPAKASEHWSFRPMTESEPPAVHDTA